MKITKNRKTLSAIAIGTLAVTIVSAVLLPSTPVLAQRRLTGLDNLIQEKTSATETFHILEIVDNGTQMGEIGFYFDGNEPFSLDENGYAVNFETTLSKITDKDERQAYMNGLLKRLDGKYWEEGDSKAQEDYPLQYQGYEETYFPKDEASWNRVDFAENVYVEIAGEYVPVQTNTAGETVYGDYTQNSDYVIAYDSKSGTYNGDYRENLAGFDVSSMEPAYNVVFGKDYEEEYGYLGVYTQQFDSVGSVDSQAVFDALKEQNGGIYWVEENGSYREINLNAYVYGEAAEGSDQLVLTSGTVLYNVKYVYAGAANDGSGKEYYYVQGYSYAYDGYEYTGNYGAILKNGEEQYISCTPGTGTHKLSEYDYSYTPGMGNYDFVEDDTKPLEFVEVKGFYYKGGFTNNNWFRQKVFLSEEGDISLNLLPVSVRTLTVDQLSEACSTSVSIFNDIDLLVISCSAGAFDKVSHTVSANIAKRLDSEIGTNKLACIVNSALVNGKNNSQIVETIKEHYTSKESAQIGSVDNNIYWYEGELFNTAFGDIISKEDAETAFADVLDYIKEENKYLELRKEELIPEDISQAVVIQYILSCKYARNIAPKSGLTVLEIEPCADYVLTNDKVRTITGYDTLEDEQIKIVQMTTAEFVGKIHDLNGVYDFIYFGMQTGLMNTNSSGETVYNDSGMNGLVYTHTGDAVIAAERLTGLLNTDFVEGNKANLPYSRDVYKIRTSINSDGYLDLNKQTIEFTINTPGKAEEKKRVTLGNQGVYRYSGNDITEENLEQLLDYVNAGYPVILDKEFAVEGTIYDNMSAEMINTKKIDNSSCLYQFLSLTFAKENVFLSNGALSTDENFSFYMNLPKLHLKFYKEANDGSTLDYYIEDTEITDHLTDSTSRFVKRIDGQYYLTYVFSIEDQASASVRDTKYTVSLFVDINSDGKYSREHEKMQDVRVTKVDGTGVAVDELVAGEKYIVTRRIPEAFRSIVPWKLEVSLTKAGEIAEDGTTAASNDQSLIRKSQIGYSKLYTDQKTDIHIYQIMSNTKGLNNGDNNTWNLEADYGNVNSDFRKDVTSLKEYNLDFKSVYVDQYQSPNGTELSSGEAYYETIQDYDMLIIGFSDVYEGFTNKYAVEGILKFMETGKSVLFTHDTTSFVNYPGESADNVAGGSLLGSIFPIMDNSDTAIGGARWGYLFNQIVRDKLGMDRYGITNPDSFLNANNENTSASETLTIEEAKKELERLLKTGEILNTNEKVVTYLPETTYTGTVAQLIALANKDAAYVAGTNKAQTYPETQGYTYTALNNCEELIRDNNKIVKGELIGTHTNYLNLNRNSGVHNLGKTWSDSFKEFFEDIFGSDSILGGIFGSIGDWLGGLFDKYLGSIHNGSFDKMEITCVNQGQITEYPFRIGDSVAVSSTHAQYYQLDLEADQDNDGESDIVVWYCISDGYNNGKDGTANPYSASPNDVRNNYYIYSIGNVFYTGAGHKAINRTEKQLFINTMVAAYNAAVNEPSVTVLDSESVYAAEKSSLNMPVEYSMADKTDNSAYIGDTNIQIHYSVYDDNFVYASDTAKTLSVEYFIEDSQGDETINGVKVKKLENIQTTQNGSLVDTIVSGNAYTAVWYPTSAELYQYLSNNESFDIYVRVTSEFMYNGTLSKLYGYDKLIVKKTNLFELD